MKNDRIKAILERYNNGDTALFNWCDEYKEWVDQNIIAHVTEEWEYILKKSTEDSETPFSYDDIELYYYDKTELIRAIIEDTEYLEQDLEFKTVEELKQILDNETLLDLDDYEHTKEIYRWFIVGEDLKHWVEKVDPDEVFLKGAWGRQCYGQHISLDSVVIRAFIAKIRQEIISFIAVTRKDIP